MILLRPVNGVRRRVSVARVRAAFASGGHLPHLDLVRDGNGTADALRVLLQGAGPSSSLLWWARAELQRGGATARILDGLVAQDPEQRARCAQLAGALRLQEAIPWLGRVLATADSPLRGTAAHALGTLGGAASADALVRGLYWRRGGRRRIVIELARAAPDHYLEAAVFNPDLADVRAELAIALGLRRRRTGVPVLVQLYGEGSRSERAVACAALGWAADEGALPTLHHALEDAAWQVREAAAKALGRIGAAAAHGVEAELEAEVGSVLADSGEWATPPGAGTAFHLRPAALRARIAP